MAKKVVANLQKAKEKSFSKVIRSVRSPETGAYTFKEEVVSVEAMQEMLAERR